MAAVTTTRRQQPRIVNIKQENSAGRNVRGEENRVLPACCYRVSPEVWMVIVGVIMLPFLMPVANLIVSAVGILIKSWLHMVGGGVLSVLWTTLAFVKVVGMGCLLSTVAMFFMYLIHVYNADPKNGRIIPGFADFCLSILYSVGFPVPGSVLNFLSTDGR